MSDTTATAPSAAPAATPSTSAPAAKAPTTTGPKVEVKPTLTAKTPGDTTKTVGDTATPQGATSVKPDAEAALGDSTESPAERKARKLKLKVDGAEIDYDVDSTPDDELATELQLAKAARKRMQEAADQRKKVGEFWERLKADPFKAMEDAGYTPEQVQQMMEERLRQKYMEEEMPQTEREKLQLQRELEQERQYRQRIEAERKAAIQAEYDAKVREEMTNEFHSALEESGLPKTPHTVYVLAEIAKFNDEHKLGMTTKQMAAEARKRLGGVNQAVLRNLKGAALLSYVGDDVVKEIVRLSVEKVKASRSASAAKPFEPPVPQTKTAFDVEEDAKPARRMESQRFFRDMIRGK